MGVACNPPLSTVKTKILINDAAEQSCSRCTHAGDVKTLLGLLPGLHAWLSGPVPF